MQKDNERLVEVMGANHARWN